MTSPRYDRGPILPVASVHSCSHPRRDAFNQSESYQDFSARAIVVSNGEYLQPVIAEESFNCRKLLENHGRAYNQKIIDRRPNDSESHNDGDSSMMIIIEGSGIFTFRFLHQLPVRQAKPRAELSRFRGFACVVVRNPSLTRGVSPFPDS